MFRPYNLPFRIRQSTLEDSRCLYRFHRNHVLGLREPESVASARGQQVHALARQYVDFLVASKQDMDWGYAERLANECEDEDAARLFHAWAMRRSFEPSRIFATEYKIRLNWDLEPCDDKDTVFAADMDRLELDGNEADVWDYKSHFAAFDPTTIQAIIYPWMLWKLMPHLEIVRFHLDFMRWGIIRSREFTRADLARMDVYIQNHVDRLIEAFTSDVWPATVNSKCVYCHHDCPLVAAGLSRESIGQIQSPAHAQALARQLYALQGAATRIHWLLRGYATTNGPISAGNDIELGFGRQERYDYDARTILRLNEEHGFAAHRALRGSPREIQKIGKDYPEYQRRAVAAAKDRSRTVFKFTNTAGDPLADNDDEVID